MSKSALAVRSPRSKSATSKSGTTRRTKATATRKTSTTKKATVTRKKPTKGRIVPLRAAAKKDTPETTQPNTPTGLSDADLEAVWATYKKTRDDKDPYLIKRISSVAYRQGAEILCFNIISLKPRGKSIT